MGKLIRRVREGADGKGPVSRAPRRRPTSLDGRELETRHHRPWPPQWDNLPGNRGNTRLRDLPPIHVHAPAPDPTVVVSPVPAELARDRGDDAGSRRGDLPRDDPAVVRSGLVPWTRRRGAVSPPGTPTATATRGTTIVCNGRPRCAMSLHAQARGVTDSPRTKIPPALYRPHMIRRGIVWEKISGCK